MAAAVPDMGMLLSPSMDPGLARPLYELPDEDDTGCFGTEDPICMWSILMGIASPQLKEQTS